MLIDSRGQNKVVQKRKSNHNVLSGSVMETINTLIININIVLIKIIMGKWQDQKDMCMWKQHGAGEQDAILGNKAEPHLA